MDSSTLVASTIGAMSAVSAALLTHIFDLRKYRMEIRDRQRDRSWRAIGFPLERVCAAYTEVYDQLLQIEEAILAPEPNGRRTHSANSREFATVYRKHALWISNALSEALVQVGIRLRQCEESTNSDLTDFTHAIRKAQRCIRAELGVDEAHRQWSDLIQTVGGPRR
ncbi:MAG: hypothetical protein HY763_12810 [Planctomycetes bacterium]|nr:hypothetical protein [Planctomycetota bacterium]